MTVRYESSSALVRARRACITSAGRRGTRPLSAPGSNTGALGARTPSTRIAFRPEAEALAAVGRVDVEAGQLLHALEPVADRVAVGEELLVGRGHRAVVGEERLERQHQLGAVLLVVGDQRRDRVGVEALQLGRVVAHRRQQQAVGAGVLERQQPRLGLAGRRATATFAASSASAAARCRSIGSTAIAAAARPRPRSPASPSSTERSTACGGAAAERLVGAGHDHRDVLSAQRGRASPARRRARRAPTIVSARACQSPSAGTARDGCARPARCRRSRGRCPAPCRARSGRGGRRSRRRAPRSRSCRPPPRRRARARGCARPRAPAASSPCAAWAGSGSVLAGAEAQLADDRLRHAQVDRGHAVAAWTAARAPPPASRPPPRAPPRASRSARRSRRARPPARRAVSGRPAPDSTDSASASSAAPSSAAPRFAGVFVRASAIGSPAAGR